MKRSVVFIFLIITYLNANEKDICKKFPLDINKTVELAKEGNAYCQAVLGSMLWRGLGIKLDENKSLYWSKLSWEANETLGLYNKGVFYGGTQGIKKDEKLSKNAYAQAKKAMINTKDLEDPNYLFSLGVIIEFGYDGSNSNKTKGCKYYLQAATLGHPIAQHNYAICLSDVDIRGKKDIENAIIWYETALVNGYVNSASALGNLYKKNKNKIKAFKYYFEAAELGSAKDKFDLACILENGLLVDYNITKAANFYVKASKLGHTRATYRLAWLYFIGKNGIEKDIDKAKHLFQKAANSGDGDAINMLKAMNVSY